MTPPDRIRALIDDYLAEDADAMIRDRLGRIAALAPAAPAPSPSILPHLLCPSCERNPITRNGRCEECQWAVS